MAKRPQEVRDRPTEIGINLNTIFTAIMLAVLVWVGKNIEDIKDKMGAFSTTVAVMQETVANNGKKLDDHISDKRVHRQ